MSININLDQLYLIDNKTQWEFKKEVLGINY